MNTMEQNFNNAKKEIRALGVKVRVNIMECCRGCVTEEKLGLKDKTQPHIWTYGGQDNAVSWVDGLPYLRSDVRNRYRLTEKDLVNSEFFNHGNLTPELGKQIVFIFQTNGFVVDWDGDEYRCIEIDFKATKNAMDTIKAALSLQTDYAQC